MKKFAFDIGSNPKSQSKPLTRKEQVRGIIGYFLKNIQDNRLSDVAGNISFTIILSLVPILAIMMAVFTTFPEFGTLQDTLKTYFAQGMIPENIAQTILNYLGAFASNAANVSIVGGLALLTTTLTTIATIERAFDRIWHVVVERTLPRKVVLYLLIAMAAPMLLGISVVLTTRLMLTTHGLLASIPVIDSFAAPLVAVLWTTLAFTLLYKILPHQLIMWKDAAAGGLFASIAFEVAIRAFAIFIVNFSSYERIYGALAAFPIFMIWIYISSFIMLLGAQFTALLPDVREGRWRSTSALGNHFSNAMKLIALLYDASRREDPVLSCAQLERFTRIGFSETEYCLTRLEALGWVATPKQSLISSVSFSKKDTRKWEWTGDAHTITVAQVFREFVFHMGESDNLSAEVDHVIGDGLNLTLASYFEMTGVGGMPAKDA